MVDLSHFVGRLVFSRPHLGGEQRRYNVGGGYEVSMVNAPSLHREKFAWEAAIIWNGRVAYETSLTSDVEVFETEEGAAAFLQAAILHFGGETPIIARSQVSGA